MKLEIIIIIIKKTIHFIHYVKYSLYNRDYIPSSTTITANIGNGNYRCSSVSDDIGQFRPDIAVLPGKFSNTSFLTLRTILTAY